MQTTNDRANDSHVVRVTEGFQFGCSTFTATEVFAIDRECRGSATLEFKRNLGEFKGEFRAAAGQEAGRALRITDCTGVSTQHSPGTPLLLVDFAKRTRHLLMDVNCAVVALTWVLSFGVRTIARAIASPVCGHHSRVRLRTIRPRLSRRKFVDVHLRNKFIDGSDRNDVCSIS